MDGANLRKYTIVASNVNGDDDLAAPADMTRFLTPYGRDMAVVDIHDFVHVFAMELNADELREPSREPTATLRRLGLCGRADIVDKFNTAVEGWLERQFCSILLQNQQCSRTLRNFDHHSPAPRVKCEAFRRLARILL